METELVIVFIAVIAFGIGAIQWQKGALLLSKGKKAEAVVFKNNYKRSGSESGVYYPVVRFQTEDQKWITQELDYGQSPAKPEGTKLEVLYDPDNPATVEVNSTFRLEILPRILVAIGIIGFTTAVLVYLEFISL
ncbi:MAG: DUF3592 domain-containing protein [Reichenbachiella sp.]